MNLNNTLILRLEIQLQTVTTTVQTSISECLSPQDLAYDGCPHRLHLRGAGLEYKGVLRLPPTEPNLKAQAAVTNIFSHTDLCCLHRKEQRM